MKDKTLGMLTAWHLLDVHGQLYVPMMHYVYINYASRHFNKIVLFALVRQSNSSEGYAPLNFSNLEIISLPYSHSQMGSMVHILGYYRTLYANRNKVDYFYCRVPDPFSWMPALMIKKPTIMHFVGDTIDATNHNEKWNWLKKKVMIGGYMPEYGLTLLGARKSTVYTNGDHLATKLKRYGIEPTPVISSTVSEHELHEGFLPLPIYEKKLEITYIGYVRYAKGMHCLMNFCRQLRDADIKYHFNLIGNGEMMSDVIDFIKEEKLQGCVTLHGHIDNRTRINEILRHSDLFFFPSLSEGSPRVVIEAMSQGTPVISTPVGSLPTTFEEGKTIRFFDFNDAERAVGIVKDYLNNPMAFEKQRNAAFNLVKEKFTIERFLSTVFSLKVEENIDIAPETEMGGVILNLLNQYDHAA